MSSVEYLRKRVAQVGKAEAVMEEMIRLGLLTDQDIAASKLTQSKIKEIMVELEPTVAEIYQIQAKLNAHGNLAATIKIIRAERIAMVKARREERKIEKERNRVLRQEAWESAKRKKAPFLGVGVSERLTFEGGDLAKVVKSGLPELVSLGNIAEAMGLTTEDLVWLCYERAATETDHYTRFEIPKRAGGTRLISSRSRK